MPSINNVIQAKQEQCPQVRPNEVDATTVGAVDADISNSPSSVTRHCSASAAVRTSRMGRNMAVSVEW